MKGWLWLLVLALTLPVVAGAIDFAACFAALELRPGRLLLKAGP